MIAADETAVISTATLSPPVRRKHAACTLETRLSSVARTAMARIGGRRGGGQRCGRMGAASGETAGLGMRVGGVGEVAVMAAVAPHPAAVGRAKVNLRGKVE